MDDVASNPGPDERWRALIDHYGRYLRRVVIRLCPRYLGLRFDDIEQEARIRLWNALKAEREITDPASYLYRIAATATIDAVRRVKARREEPLEPERGDDDAAPRLSAPGSSVERAAERAILMERVEEAIGRLPPDRAAVVGLHLHGFTTQEIADLRGWTEPKARNVVYRTLRELREDLRARGVDYEGE